VEREDQAMGLVLVIVSREVQEESPLCAIGSGEVDLVALSSATLLELGVEGFAAALAGSSVCLAKEQAKAKHAKSEKSNRACHDSFSLTESVYLEWRKTLAKTFKRLAMYRKDQPWRTMAYAVNERGKDTAARNGICNKGHAQVALVTSPWGYDGVEQNKEILPVCCSER
jgi:hypothetical protein